MVFQFFNCVWSLPGRVSQTLLLRQNVTGATSALLTALPRHFPMNYAKAPNGYVYMTNGLGPVMKWDGVHPVAIKAGVEAPTTAPIISDTGQGEITGRYFAFVRFFDKDKN